MLKNLAVWKICCTFAAISYFIILLRIKEKARPLRSVCAFFFLCVNLHASNFCFIFAPNSKIYDL